MVLTINNHTFKNNEIDIIEYICKNKNNEQVINDTLIHLESGALRKFLLNLFYFETDVLSKLANISFSDTIENTMKELVLVLREIEKESKKQWEIKKKPTGDYDVEIDIWGFSRV